MKNATSDSDRNSNYGSHKLCLTRPKYPEERNVEIFDDAALARIPYFLTSRSSDPTNGEKVATAQRDLDLP